MDKVDWWDGKRAELLRGLAAQPDDLNLVPRTHVKKLDSAVYVCILNILMVR